MAKSQTGQHDEPTRKPLVWLHGEVKTPPFTAAGRQEAGMLLRFLQEGEKLGMPGRKHCPTLDLAAAHCLLGTLGTTGESCTASIRTPCWSLMSIRRRRERFRLKS